MLPNYDPFAQAKGCHIDLDKVEEAFTFLENEIKQIDGSTPGEPFPFQPWQMSIVFNLYGWYRLDGTRRYRKCFIYVPKKNGKSAFTAALILLELKLSKEEWGEIYSAASAQKQTRNVFKHVKGMVQLNERLGENLQIYGGNVGGVKSIVNNETNTVYQCLAADADTVDGAHPTMNVIDELHRHKNGELADVLQKSTAGRMSPLTIITTTADYDRPSDCNALVLYSRRVCENKGDSTKPGYAPEFLPVLYETVPQKYKDDPLYWTRPSVWKACNPNFDVTIKESDFAEMVAEALEMPGKLNSFLRLHLNIVTGQADTWLDMAAWDRCEDRLPIESFYGCECFAGLDLASVSDITAYSLAFRGVDGGIDLFVWQWLPIEVARVKERALSIPFEEWGKSGHIKLTEGDFIDYDQVVADILEINKQFNVKAVHCDSWNAASAYNTLTKAGVNVQSFRQGFISMNWPTKKTEQLIKAGRLRHGGNPCLRWQFSNVAVSQDSAENIKPDKKKSEQKIDGAVASIMAIAGWWPFQEEPELEEPCLLFI